MKTIKWFFPALLTLVLLSCGNGAQTSGAQTALEQKPDKVYQYVEPEENISQLIWNSLKAQHLEVKPVYDLAVDINYLSDDEATNYYSKTHLKYNYFVDRGSEEPDNMLVGIYEMQCYRTIDDSWIGIVTKEASGYELDEEYQGRKVFAVEYKNGTLTDLEIGTLFPDSFKIATDYFVDHIYSDCFAFDNEGMTFQSSQYWPIRVNWNGTRFEKDPESVVMRSSIHNFYGYFDAPGIGYLAIGKEPEGLNNNDDFVYNGEVLAHFILKDGKISGYSLESPKCGFVQVEVYQDGKPVITSKPIAIGLPIQNVLDYEKKPLSIKDNTIVAGYKEGGYVITQQLMHNTLERFDIFVEFAAKDENSNIETIRVYSEEIEVTLEGDLEDDDNIDSKTITIFRAIPFDDNDPELGEYYYVSGSDNGFTIHFKGTVKEVGFHTYDVDDGRTLAVISKHYDEENITLSQFWYYLDGELTQTAVMLPKPQPQDFRAWQVNQDTTIPSDGYQLTFTNQGIEYYTLSERNDETDMRDEFGIYINPDFYTVKYNWNGKSFGPDPAIE